MNASGSGPQNLGVVFTPPTAGLYSFSARLSVVGATGGGGLRANVGYGSPTPAFAFTTSTVANGETISGTVVFLYSTSAISAEVVEDGTVSNSPAWELRLRVELLSPSDLTDPL